MKLQALFFTTALLFSFQFLEAQTVLLDYYFNHETRTTKSGEAEQFHYTWEDTTNSGYSNWGKLFVENNMQLKSLKEAPANSNLQKADIYIIVDPDTEKETAHPNYIEAAHVKTITNWVKNGGVLVMLANDSANVEMSHFNLLAAAFGIHFNANNYNLVNGDDFEMGALVINEKNPVFNTAKKIFIKELCTLSLTGNATPVLTKQGNIIIATVQYGKGSVLAIGDPFIYNEYCNGRLPPGFDNSKAADDLCKWLKKQAQRL